MHQGANLLAFDLGASTGRAILGSLEGGKLALRELHRFANDPVEMAGRLYWDLPRLFFELKQGLNKCALEEVELDCVGIDTWGVDYGLLDAAGRPLGNPVHYRDTRTEGMMERAFALVPKQEIYRRTGLAFMSFNTLYQLLSQVKEQDALLSAADKLLFMPDLMAYLLTGTMGCEYTIASTSQMIDPFTRSWDLELMDKLGIDGRLLLPVTEPGILRGTLDARIARECGVGCVPVAAVAGHDTASAVAAVPAQHPDFAYISSGTWSLVGIESAKPIRSSRAQAANLTNEGGVDGSYRVLKNVMGLWIIQECKREWERRGYVLTFAQIVEAAEAAPPFLAMIDPDMEEFMYPGDMPDKIRAYCDRTSQEVPATVGEVARVVYESLALKYRWTVEKLAEVRGAPIRTLHIVGGGANNELLNRFTADALGIPVQVGPVEATAIGNLLMQARALGLLPSLAAQRQLVADSFPVKTITPGDSAPWDAAYPRFVELLK